MDEYIVQNWDVVTSIWLPVKLSKQLDLSDNLVSHVLPFLEICNALNRNCLLALSAIGFDDLAKSPLSNQLNGSISAILNQWLKQFTLFLG